MKTLKQIALPLFFLLALAYGHKTWGQTVDLVTNVDASPPININDTFTYTLQAGSSGTEYDAVQIKILYNPSKLQLNNFNPNPIFNLVILSDTAVPGEVIFTAGASPFLTTTQTIFTVEFEVLDNTLPIVIANDATSTVARTGSNVTGSKNDVDFSTLSNEKDVFKNSLSIYPNPVKDELFIKVNPWASAIRSITINTIDGKLVRTIDNINSYGEAVSVDVSNLTTTLYFMTVTSDKNYKATYKFLVKK